MTQIRKLILWDIDGTLLISKGASRLAKAQAMQEIFGTDAGVQTHHFGGKTDWQILYEVLQKEGFSHHDIGQRMPVYEKRFAEILDQIIGDFPVEALPNALELVKKFHTSKDIMQGIVTGNSTATAPIKLRAAGFDPEWFSIGAYGSEHAERNALPPIAVERAQAIAKHTIAPHDVIVVGDTLADIACAQAFGAVSVIVKTGFENANALKHAQPDYLLDDLTTFEAVVPLA